ncbi:MAG: endonuclease V, partial [bacterium]|nr:endonuclease V [bacterium]
MKVGKLHPWDVDYGQARAIQASLQKKLILKAGPKKIASVAGADVAYCRKTNQVYAAVLVFSYPDLELLESCFSRNEAAFPYIPGFLTFREAPVLMAAFEQVRMTPHLVIFDGQGIAHPRRLGLASHCGILLDLPSIGCAKSRLVGEHPVVREKRGAYRSLRFQGETVGAAVRTREGVKPVYVSPGHLTDVKSA